MIEIDKLKTSTKYIEELARKEFGMVKDGEVVFLFQN
ncbi:septum formation initiator family protein [Thermodesulfobacteriota bacterium]